MARLIDADALMEKMFNGLQDGDVLYRIPPCEVLNAPTVDAKPVVHGQWKGQPSIKSFRHTNIPVVACSHCGMNFCDIINNHSEMYRYCPYCGAKMDLEVNE